MAIVVAKHLAVESLTYAELLMKYGMGEEAIVFALYSSYASSSNRYKNIGCESIRSIIKQTPGTMQQYQITYLHVHYIRKFYHSMPYECRACQRMVSYT